MQRIALKHLHKRRELEPEIFETGQISAAVTWERHADPKAEDWREKSDQLSVTLYVGDNPLEPFSFWQGIGNRVVLTFPTHGADKMSDEKAAACRLPHRHTVYDWERSRPLAPTVADLLGCLMLDASAYEGARDYDNPVDGLIAAGLVDHTAPNFSVAKAETMFRACREQWHKLEQIKDAGITPDTIRKRLEKRGLT